MRKLLSLLTAILFVGTMWGDVTYKLTQVTSVSAGNKYVFVRDGHALSNTVSSKALTTASSYSSTGLAGNEAYVWTLESATGGFYMKNASLATSQYLNNTSKTDMSFGTASAVWSIAFTNGVALISNTSNSNRFLGDAGQASPNHTYKAYATNNLNSYEHDFTVYVLEAEVPTVTCTPKTLTWANQKQNVEPIEKTFVLKGAYLTKKLTLSASTGYSISVDEISASDAMATNGVTITVTPETPTTTGAKNGTITISGDDLSKDSTVALSMNVIETFAVNVAIEVRDKNNNVIDAEDVPAGFEATLGGETTYYADAENGEENVSLEASTITGYDFTGWSVSNAYLEVASTSSASTTATLYAAGTITANFKAKSEPEVTVTKNNITFGRVKRNAALSTQTFNLTGANLQDSHNVTVSAPTGYKVSIGAGEPASSLTITPSSGSITTQTIIVTPITATAGTFNNNLTISSDDLNNDVTIALSMTVRELYSVNWYINDTETPAETQTDTAGIALEIPDDFSSFTDCSALHFIGWKDGSAIDGGSSEAKPSLANVGTEVPEANKNYYAVFAQGTPGSSSTVLQANLANVSETGWTFNSRCYTDNTTSSVRMSTGDYTGTMTSPTLTSLASTATATLTFYVKAWSNTENGKVAISASKGTFNTTSFTTSSSSDFEEVSSTLTGGDNTTTITFTGTAGNRIFVKNVKVVQTITENFTKYYTACPGGGTGIEDTIIEQSAPALKKIVNGMLIIEKNGHIYNAMGQMIK